MLCKHIITVVLVGKKTFTDLSVLYLEHPLTNLDEDLLQNFQEDEVQDKYIQLIVVSF